FTVTAYRPGCSGSELNSPADLVRSSRCTFVLRLRKVTTASATGAFCGSSTIPTNEPCSIWANNVIAPKRATATRIAASPQCLPVAGVDRLTVAEVNLDQFFTRRNAGGHLLRRRIDHRPAVRISVLAIQAE